VRAHDCRRPGVVAGGRLDLGLGRGLRSPEFEAFGVDQAQSREMFVESFNLIRRTWADENFVHHGKYWTVVKNVPLSPPLLQRPHPAVPGQRAPTPKVRFASDSLLEGDGFEPSRSRSHET
jgi:alkanesulfonate monooxygenase SsuD/methylene tetrahydromethanopterin reductase-like flavin-dependent oxidoreductase (luciferase family)